MQIILRTCGKFKRNKGKEKKNTDKKEIEKREIKKKKIQVRKYMEENKKQLPLPLVKLKKVKKHISSIPDFIELNKVFHNAIEYAIIELSDSASKEEWFDDITVKRNLKELKEYDKLFEQVCEESTRQLGHIISLYEDSMNILERYFDFGGEEEEEEGESAKDIVDEGANEVKDSPGSSNKETQNNTLQTPAKSNIPEIHHKKRLMKIHKEDMKRRKRMLKRRV